MAQMGNFDLLKLTMHRLASLLRPLYYTLSLEAGLTDPSENKLGLKAHKAGDEVV